MAKHPYGSHLFHRPFGYWSRLPSFLSYDSCLLLDETKTRHMIVMDEALDPFASFSLSSGSIDDLVNDIPTDLA